MKASISTIFIVLILVLLSISLVASNNSVDFDSFVGCLPTHSDPSFPIADVILTPNNSSFEYIYQLRANNLRIFLSTTSRPVAIITALHPSHAQATVVCAKRYGFQVRIRSGGHDFEGLSYTSGVPFVILDMFNLHSIDIDMESETAWVQAGATTGELYYRIAEKSNVHGFPSGVCTTLGIGGHFSGGGYGFLMRKYGLSIDNVIDAQLIDANGRIRNRESMGEDVFWAIRGGGTTSFGIILSWRVKLVRVPPMVTVFTVQRTLEQGATELAYRWQQVAPKLPKDLFIRLQPQPINNGGNNRTVSISFIGHFLGKTDELIQLMNTDFPELGLQRSDCLEISWVESTLYWAGFPNGTSIDELLNRVQVDRSFSKSKSDYYKAVIPKQGLETLWEALLDIKDIFVQMNPYGGRMEEISDSETAFAHRGGNLFMVLYGVTWSESDGGIDAAGRYVQLSRRLYGAMAPYASSRPREAFLNYRDLDIGSNESGETDFEVAKEYGAKYFKNNFIRLTRVKAMIDPENFFKNEQSIPPLPVRASH
ncbi:FAD-binding and BBE domain-containing protein [Hibiscus syriacus]|uniref:FAD-binding and BBE domain-containing protein n=1 Tax=Hibiscus syriacus TaxID=106335 RepID=A0A6A2XZV0_HIBSY|nr:berberine bridge enzyme-like 4 [Hibiscus syriacus]KAE8664529.1 FAD-binding and BBE domain-containing protein [Hibiscus syriacus]